MGDEATYLAWFPSATTLAAWLGALSSTAILIWQITKWRLRRRPPIFSMKRDYDYYPTTRKPMAIKLLSLHLKIVGVSELPVTVSSLRVIGYPTRISWVLRKGQTILSLERLNSTVFPIQLKRDQILSGEVDATLFYENVDKCRAAIAVHVLDVRERVLTHICFRERLLRQYAPTPPPNLLSEIMVRGDPENLDKCQRVLEKNLLAVYVMHGLVDYRVFMLKIYGNRELLEDRVTGLIRQHGFEILGAWLNKRNPERKASS